MGKKSIHITITVCKKEIKKEAATMATQCSTYYNSLSKSDSIIN